MDSAELRAYGRDTAAVNRCMRIQLDYPLHDVARLAEGLQTLVESVNAHATFIEVGLTSEEIHVREVAERLGMVRAFANVSLRMLEAYCQVLMHVVSAPHQPQHIGEAITDSREPKRKALELREYLTWSSEEIETLLEQPSPGGKGETVFQGAVHVRPHAEHIER